jgi:CRISPR-associated exonuclease Cas4
MIVEYKHGGPKTADCDRLQLAAQVMAFEEMHGTNIETAALFYWRTRHREIVDITKELRKAVEGLSEQMHGMIRKETIIAPDKKAACKACSLYEICGPDKFDVSAEEYLKGLLE